MDKLMNRSWVMKIIALLLAFMLYLSVNLDDGASSSNKILNRSSSANTGVETLTDVPVQVSYNEKNRIVRGVPDTVIMTLEGPKNILAQTKLQKDYQAYIDLDNLSLGQHRVKVQYRNISDNLNVVVKPDIVNVTIEERDSKQFSVEASYDKNKVKNGYEAGEATVSPRAVTVTGASSQLDQVAYVKAIIDLDNASKTVTKQATVVALDKNLNKLNVTVQPETVNVTIPVRNISKKVPVDVIQEGTPGDGVNITKLEPKTDTVKIIGPSDSLEKIDKIDNIPVDVTGITKSKDIKVNVPVPDGIDSVSPKQITVHVEVDKQGDEKDAEETDASATETKSKSFKNLPVSLTGQSSKYTYELLSPTSVDADVKGPKSDLDKLTKSGISLSANVENLSAGEHTVPIIINSPDSVTSTLSTKQAKVRVTAKKQSGTNDEQTDKETSGSTSDKETKPDTGTGSGTNPGTGNSGDSADKPSEETDTPEDNTDTPTDSTETGDDSSNNQSDENSTPVDGQTDNTSGN
ncbi:CdaR family protein [Priestia megaterium]|uniref:CdaR family protein n=1 Tax=Priestia megaterium TaxID=1404 RepID=UPI00345AF392